MTSRYRKKFTVPDGFAALLKDFTREVLREQPSDIYDYGAQYFADMNQRQVEAAQDAQPVDITELSEEELHDFILDLFLVADDDKNGYLDRKEFKTVLQSAEMGLTSKDIRSILEETDENADGVIEYREFLPMMVDLVAAMRAKRDAAEEKAWDEEAARQDAEDYLIHGMHPSELEALIKDIFHKADADGSGKLDRQEFKDCLRSADLGLTKKEINLLMSEVDLDGDGLVDFEEFVPICFNILVERYKDHMMREDVDTSSDELEQLLLTYFESADEDGGGYISQKKCKAALEEASYDVLGLTRMQIVTIMSESGVDGQGRVDYKKFARSAATIIYNLMDNSKMSERVQAMQTLADTPGMDMLRGMDRETVCDIFEQAFLAADTDGSGTLDYGELYDLLQAIGTGELALTDREISALLSVFDPNDDGEVTYSEFITTLFDTLIYLNREDHIQEIAFKTFINEIDDAIAQDNAGM